jgi:glycosyltransferase involved in cell wall biosynthesis
MTRPRKVLEVLGRSAGGIAGHVSDITEGLQDRKDLAISIAAPPDLAVRMPTEIVPVLIPDGPWGHRLAACHLHRIILDGHYDIVHSHGLRAAIDSARAARRTPARPIATIHNLVLPEISGNVRAALYRRAEPLAVRWNAHLFAPSADIARRLQTAAPGRAQRVEVLHLGVSPPSRPPRDRGVVRAELGLKPTDQLLVTVARLAAQKALDVLLGVVALLPEHVHLAIVGSGPEEAKLRTLAADLGLSPRVSFLGYRSEPQDQVAAADIFCLTSVWEACSLAAQEAMLLGVPVVTTAVGGMPELVEDRVSGRLVGAGDERAFAAVVAELLTSPEERHRLAESAALYRAQHFSRARMLERLERAYRGDIGETA